MNVRQWPGFKAAFLTCSFGHDHGDPTCEVVGLEAERQTLGKERRPMFHCASCGMVQSGSVTSEVRHYPNMEAAMATGNVLPCGMCFRDLRKFFMDYLLGPHGR